MMKRKIVKAGVITLAVVAALILIAALTVSPIVKSYVVKHSKEMIGRKIAINGLHINIFTGSLEIDSVRMFEKDDKTVFASIDSFYMNLTLHKLLSSKVEITELKVVRPYAQIIQNKDKFNFDDLMHLNDNKKNDTVKSSFPKSVVFKNIMISGGTLVYTDRQINNTLRMKELGVAVPELCLEQGNTKAGIRLKLGDKATLESHLTYDMKGSGYTLTLKINDLPLATFYPYARQYMNITHLEGLLNTDFRIKGNTNHAMDFILDGTADASGLDITGTNGEPIAAAGTVSAGIAQLSLSKSTYLFDYVHAGNVDLQFIMREKTNNYTHLMKELPADTSATAQAQQPMKVKIKDLHIGNSKFTFTDKTLVAPFSLPMRNVDFAVKDFDMSGTNQYQLSLSFPEGGTARLKWKGNVNDLANQQINVGIRNMSLKLLSPYCLQYMAYDITDGNFNFTSRNNIIADNITSSNTLDAYKASVGKKHRELKPEYNVPLKLALYILKDKDDKISFDVPVKGNIKDPKFSYSKIVFKTLVNLMVKIAVSPIRFLAGAFGMNADKMEAIDIDPLQADFTAEQYHQLNDLAAIMKKKPEMSLSLTQFTDTRESVQGFALLSAKQDYLLSLQGNDPNKHVSFDQIRQLGNSDAGFTAWLTGRVKAGGAQEGSLSDNIGKLYPADSLSVKYAAMLERRNQRLRDYMSASLEIPADKLTIRTADKSMLDAYNAKAKYKVEMHLPGEEPVTATPEDKK
jgi:hypothetical protein